MYIYIYTHREREREREIMHITYNICIHIVGCVQSLLVLPPGLPVAGHPWDAYLYFQVCWLSRTEMA